MRITTAAGSIIGTLLLAACAGTLGEGTSTTTQSLEGDGTIPRVPNPPLQSDRNNLPGDLRGVAVPKANFAGYVKDPEAAIRLGKAFFWDMQVGADGVTACASCHFRAGADPRSKNQLSPGLKRVTSTGAASPDLTFTKGGPNYQLQTSDFPLSRLATPGVRGELDPATDNNDVVSSQGVHHLTMGEADPQNFRVGSANTRRVEPRNTPSVINAVFNHRQFWDGRAENTFNGVNNTGMRDPSARVLRVSDKKSNPVAVAIAISNASLASQAVAPIVSDLEMAAPGGTTQDVARRLAKWPRELGKRVGRVRPLGKQQVSPTDSVLGEMSRWPKQGLNRPSYDKMIADAFEPQWWDSKKIIVVDSQGNVSFADKADNDPTTEEYTLAQYNFALIFGIAVQMYEETLVSDDTPWDRFRREHPSATDPALNPWTNTNPNHISRLALFGASLFNDRTRGPTNIRCSNCHEQAELTDASSRRINAAVNGPIRNRDGNIIDKGFNNIGVRPTDNDLGAGASDAFGPLSFTLRTFSGPAPVGTTFDGALVNKDYGVQGAFKIPSLRNVALTAPYFHNGDARTLREAVELYSRGGNVLPKTQNTDPNVNPAIEPLGVPSLSNDEIDAIVAFLESLTDERVLHRRAPFDHPQLFVPNGHPGDNLASVDVNGDGLADDNYVEINAVGASGGTPIPGFLEPGPFGSGN